MKSLKSNIVWKTLFFMIVFLLLLTVVHNFASNFGVTKKNAYTLGLVLSILFYYVFLQYRIYRKISKPLYVLGENIKNSLSGNWTEIKSLGSEITELENLENLSKYVFENMRGGKISISNEKITELKQFHGNFLNEKLEKDASKFRLAVDSAEDMIIIVDKYGYINYINHACTKVLGLKFEEVENKRITDLWHKEDDSNIWKKNYESLLKDGKSIQFTTFGIKKNNLKFEASIQITAIKNADDSVEHFLIIERDITEEKQKERIKSEFISVVSHELRTPMSVIRGYAAILAEEKLGTLTDKQKEYVNKINSETARLLDLANDMLDIQKFESGKIELKFEKTDMAKFVSDIVEGQKDIFSKKNLQLSFENSLTQGFSGIDTKYFARVITNLLSNAYKYTEKGEVKVFLVNPDNEHIVLAVKDTGVGIKEEALNHLFERFYQADGVMQRKQEGSGLGLSIVKRVVESHNGMVWVESKVGVGTTFYVAIPIAK